MIVLVLVLIWAAVLTPFALRRLAEYQATSSEDSFRYGLRRLHRARFTSLGPVEAPIDQVATPKQEVARPALTRRHRQQIERRRRVLLSFAGAILATFTLGAIPQLRSLWYLSLVALIFGLCYVALLAMVVRNEMLAAERRQKVVTLLPPRPFEALATRLAASASSRGGDIYAVAVRPVQPGFRIIDGPAGR